MNTYQKNLSTELLGRRNSERKLVCKASAGRAIQDVAKITSEGLESLGKLGTAGKIAELGITMLDPTGITGWQAFGEAAALFSKEKTAANFGKLILAGLGAMPATSTATKLLGKSEKLLKGADKAQDLSKGIKEIKKLEEGVEDTGKLFRTTGATATVPNNIITAVDKLRISTPEARKDKELAELSEFLHTSYRKNEELPKEFVQYLRAIFKTPVMEKKLGVFTGKVKIKTSYTFKNPKDSQEAINKLKVASKSINKDTKEFKFSEAIRDEIYLKSKAYVQSFSDNEQITSVFRKNFNDKEVPEILNYQTSPEISQLYSKEQLQGPLGDLYKMGEEIAAEQRQLRKTLSDQYKTDVRFVPVYTVTRGKYKLVPKRIYNKGAKRWETRRDLVYLDKQGKESPVPIEGIHDYYVRGYAPAVNGTPLLEHIVTNVEQHHEKPLAQWMADAFLRNPKETDPKKLLETYIAGRPEDYYKGYIPLLKEFHTGAYAGIHKKSALTLSEFTRIKGFTRSFPAEHATKNSDEIIDYLIKTKSEQEVGAVLSELKPIQNRIETLQVQLQRVPGNKTFKEALDNAYDQYIDKLIKYSREFESTTSQKISALKQLVKSAPEKDIEEYEKLGKSLRGGFEKVWLKSVSKEFSDAELGKIATITEKKLLKELGQYKNKNITLFSVKDSGQAAYDIFTGDSRIGYVNGNISEGIFTPSYVESLSPGNKGIFERGINSVVRSGYKYRTGDHWASPEIQGHVVKTRFTNPKGIKVVSNKGVRDYNIDEAELSRDLSFAAEDDYQTILETLDRGYEAVPNQPVYLISKRSNIKNSNIPVPQPIVRNRYIPSLDRIGPSGLRSLIDSHLYKIGGKLLSKNFNIYSLGNLK